jgi:hypothetical protein
MPTVSPPPAGAIAPAVEANPIPAEELARQAAPPRRRPILDPVEPEP